MPFECSHFIAKFYPVPPEDNLAHCPTSSSASYHSLRVYHQVQKWNGVYKCEEDWGWKMIDGHMAPAQTDMQPAPAYVLEAINCKCKSNCSTRRYSCVKFVYFVLLLVENVEACFAQPSFSPTKKAAQKM